MKKYIITPVLALLLMAGSAFAAQSYPEEYLGLPGDNLNLYAVMNVFQESETLEAFERKLNDPEEVVNNLDLNNDGYVDYLMVNDYQYENGTIHNIVLSVALNQNEAQDVAVFVVEKKRDGSVVVQLIGDEALYGKNYIIEPQYAETPNPGYRGRVVRTQPAVVHTTYYEVASWPLIVYISRPAYVVWRTRWYWGFYPTYWSPWRVHYWHYYYGYHYHWYDYYYSHYRPWRHYRVHHYHRYYYNNIRQYSPVVVVNINRGIYKDTYSRPESRREGEALYAHRSSSGGRVPGGGRSGANVSTRSNENISREGTVTAPRSSGSRRETTPAATERRVESQQGNDARRPAAGVNESRTSRGSAVKTQTPARNTARQQSEQRNAGATTPRVSTQRNPAPDRKVERPSASQRSSGASSAPRVSSQRGSSERTSAPRVTSQPNRSDRSGGSVRSSSGNSNRSSTPRVSSPSRSSNRSSGTVRSSERNSNRSSGSVRSSERNSNRSGSTTRSSNERSRR